MTPKQPSAKSILKKLAAEVYAAERVVLKCALEMTEHAPNVEDADEDHWRAFHDGIVDLRRAARRLLDCTTV